MLSATSCPDVLCELERPLPDVLGFTDAASNSSSPAACCPKAQAAGTMPTTTVQRRVCINRIATFDAGGPQIVGKFAAAYATILSK
jgi:hypothetical protein